ncbi:hypothetical protein [Anaerobiospirillum thomasii]|uniref:Uncharacterized protein n=1 Tax=Anaerobiospirillum thomasii TaxID=179995 RepID=A0A2X0VNE2_9GAMM|nr:hypothetical protein [Anaerobiospirillum thomasii]SPT71038.1 Uncharacterised protein [Anaerobiospirillum thomasii]
MNWIFDINTKLKLLLSFLIVVVLTITISATSAVSNSSASDTAEEISQVLQILWACIKYTAGTAAFKYAGHYVLL